jgi:hypothetical protein
MRALRPANPVFGCVRTQRQPARTSPEIGAAICAAQVATGWCHKPVADARGQPH